MEIQEKDSESVRSVGVCRVCLKSEAKYTCPRCNLPYCSLICYKTESHSTCSESFYQEWCLTEMRNLNVEPEHRRAMLDILKGSLDESSEDVPEDISQEEDDQNDLSERIKGLDLDADSDMVWEKLTKSEQREFLRLVESGNISHFVKPCRPWWIPSLVQEMGTCSSEPSDHVTCEVPKIRGNIKPLKELLGDKPASPLVMYSLADVLLSYVYVFRYFNGEFGQEDLIEEAVDCYLTICRSLNPAIKQPCPNFEVLVAEFSNRFTISSNNRAQSVVYPFNPELLIGLLHDLYLLVNDLTKNYPQAALSDCRHLLKSASKAQRSTKYVYGLKKLDFLLSYSVSNDFKITSVDRLLAELEIELCRRVSTTPGSDDSSVNNNARETSDVSFANIAPSKLIQEL